MIGPGRNVFIDRLIVKNGLGSAADPAGFLSFDLAGTSPRVYTGSGDPNGLVAAPAGSQWLRNDAPQSYTCQGGMVWTSNDPTAAALAAASVFVLRPGAAPTSPNVFATWADLYATVAGKDYPVTIYFDDSIVSPIPIGPAGNYPLPAGTTFCGVYGADSSGALIQFVDGATINNADGTIGVPFFENIRVDTLSTVPVFSPTAPNQHVLVTHGSSLTANGTAPLFAFSAAPSVDVFVLEDRSILAVGAYEVVETLAATSLIMYGGAVSGFNGSTIRGLGVLVPITASSAAQFNLTQPNFAGIIFGFFATAASKVGYTAANAADWNGSAPTEVATALDRLAAFVGPVT